MEVPRIARTVAKTLLGRQAALQLRRWFRRTVPELHWYLSSFGGRHGLEIGGPSQIFGNLGSIPVYGALGSLDNCLYSRRTIWQEEVTQGRNFRYHPARPPGLQFILEATDLHAIPDSHYDCVLSSHTLEHIANPLRALREWKRVTRYDGFLLLVLPHKDATFDWRRPATTVAHMIEDFDGDAGEDDLSHIPEILALHDLKKDKAAGSLGDFRSRCLNNYVHRALHHHVFDTPTAIAMLDHAGFQILRIDLLKPFHIILVARCCDCVPDNAAFMAADAEYKRRSPFASDRRNLSL